MINVIAVDLGASGGRIIRGAWSSSTKKIELFEIHRFANEPVKIRDTLHWDILRIFHEIQAGIRETTRTLPLGTSIASLGIDTWGVDYGLLDANDRLIDNPVHYRDSRTDGQVEKLAKELGSGTLFNATGIQDAWFNTSVQLTAALKKNPQYFDGAESLLFIPDLLNFFLTGIKQTERTIASTSQLLSIRDRDWDEELLSRLNIPRGLMQPVTDPGRILGFISPKLRKDLGFKTKVPVALVSSHDTASAALAVPTVSGKTFAFISCGTWSILGTELDVPILGAEALQRGFSNETGADGKTLLQKSVMGMWLIQECKHWWERDGEKLDYGEMVLWAEKAPPWSTSIDVNHPLFSTPGDLPERIRTFCKATGQEIPETQGAILRTIIESLACEYRRSLENLESIIGTPIEEIWLVGGGVKNSLLCQLSATISGREVRTGPTETTALGNVISQMKTLGVFPSTAEARSAIADSFGVRIYEPAKGAEIEPAFARWKMITEK